MFSPPSGPLTDEERVQVRKHMGASDLERRQQAFQDDVSKRKKKDHTFTAKKLAARIKDVEAMRASGEWDKAYAQHFVALYVVRHEEVYGIKPAMTDETRTSAVIMAHRLLATRFEQDATEMAIFMRDVWIEEERAEKWRRENNREGGILTWYRQFENGTLVDKWHLNRVRKGKV